MASIGEFLDKLGKRLEKDSGAKIFFDCFLRGRLLEKLNEAIQEGTIDLETAIADQRTWEGIYYVAAEILWDAAASNYSEVHPDIYEEANRVSVAFHEEIKDYLKFDLQFIPIRSMTDRMAEAGLIEVKDGLVRLTSKGEQVAKEVNDTISK